MRHLTGWPGLFFTLHQQALSTEIDLLIDAKPLPLHTELKGRQLIKSGYMKKHAPLNTEVTVKQKGQEHTDSMK